MPEKQPHDIQHTAQAHTPDLTQRAGYTFAMRSVQDSARFAAAFFTTPLIIAGLGAELYGAWTMIQQIAGYLANYDVRAQGTLKLRLALAQNSADWGKKRRLVGAALGIFAFSLPVLFIAGALLVALAPSIIHVQAAYAGQIRFALGICVCNLAVGRLFSLPGNVLRGENLEFRAGGFVALAIIAEALLMLAAVKLGYGLPGLAVMSISGLVLAGLIQFFVLLGSVAWFGVELPSRAEIWEFARISIWILVSGFAHLLLNASDILLVGFLAGPAVAAVYATTGAAVRFSLYPLSQLLTSGNAGIGNLCGGRQWGRLLDLRLEMKAFCLFGCSIMAGPVIALNGSFVPLWVGAEYYAGSIVTTLLALSAALSGLLAIDGLILDSLLRFKARALLMACAGLVMLPAAAVLHRFAGVAGILGGICCGKLLALILQWRVMRSPAVLGDRISFAAILRPLLAFLLIAAAGFLLQDRIAFRSWSGFIPAAFIAGIIAAGLFSLCGLSLAQRRTLAQRAGRILGKGVSHA